MEVPEEQGGESKEIEKCGNCCTGVFDQERLCEYTFTVRVHSGGKLKMQDTERINAS